MLLVIAYLGVSYVGGFVLGMPLGMLLAFGLARPLQPLSRRLNDLQVVGQPETESSLQAAHLRRTTRALVAIGSAMGCGIAAAIFSEFVPYSPGGLVQFAFLAIATSFWNFKLLLALPAGLAYAATLSVFGLIK